MLAFEDNFNDEYEYIGGVSLPNSKKKKPIKDRQENPRNALEITEIGTIILNDIIDKYPFIYQGNNMNDNKLIETVYQLLKERSFILTNLEFDLLLRYLRENIFTVLKNKIIHKHPLFDCIKNHDIGTRFKLLNAIGNNFDYKKKVAITKAMSSTWNGLNDLFIYEDRRIDFKNDLIHSLFMILYACKLPGFEDVSILQDYSMMVDEIKNNDFNKNNLMLLFLRTADTSLLPSKDINHLTYSVNNEILRINISMLLRELSYSIRSGSFENKASDMLLLLLKEIKMLRQGLKKKIYYMLF
ncbi:unnamed protein product [Macrosiphum euphorbiae]|uniref:Uncharacterized protein n=1 Tax=Macrosiphum euphorbiae TaxID=13131 RepID=A0AAV0W4K5_9HEMI|nr:unnamed protein product [Macrosiphum euphorbiae]